MAGSQVNTQTARSVEVLNTKGGPSPRDNYFGPGGGTGKLAMVGGQFRTKPWSRCRPARVVERLAVGPAEPPRGDCLI